MFKRNWIVYVTYRNRKENKLEDISLLFEGFTKKEAKSKAIDYICFNSNGPRVGIRDVYFVKPFVCNY